MSHTPRIVIDYSDLDKAFKKMTIELDLFDDVLKFIYEAYSDKYAGMSELKGLKIMILHPELTFFNHEVRNWLYEHDVEYAEIN